MRRALILCALCLVTLAVYGPVRHYGFVYEDTNAASENPSVTMQQPIQIDRARWLSALSHRLDYWAFGPSPVSFHVTNVALHLWNGLFVALIVWRLWPESTWLGGLAAGIFLLHPIQTEAVAYVASRSELLAAALALPAFWLHLGAAQWWRSVAIVVLIAFAVCAKESIAMIVPLLVLTDVLLHQRIAWRRWAWCLVPIGLMAVSVLLFDHRTTSSLGTFWFAATQASAFWRYLAMVLVPLGQTVDHDYELVAGGWHVLAMAMLVWSALLVGLLMLSDWHRRFLLMVAWAPLYLSPRFVMRIPEILNEHQMYVPMVGISICLALLIERGHLTRDEDRLRYDAMTLNLGNRRALAPLKDPCIPSTSITLSSLSTVA